MARNIEIKARIESVALLTPKVAELASEGPIEIAQDDTFFNCVTGRLKLRAFSNDAGELIFYRRVNQTGPKESFYLRSPTSSPETLRESLTLAYGQVGRVRKYRTLFLVGRTRVHLTESRTWAIFSSSKSCWWATNPPSRAFAKRVTSWNTSEFSLRS